MAQNGGDYRFTRPDVVYGSPFGGAPRPTPPCPPVVVQAAPPAWGAAPAVHVPAYQGAVTWRPPSQSHYGEVLLAGLVADAVTQRAVHAQQARVEDDIVRRGQAARLVVAATGVASAEQLQWIAEADVLLQARHAQARRSQANRRRARRFSLVVVAVCVVAALMLTVRASVT